MSRNFQYQPFVAVSGNLGVKVPVVDDVLSSREQKVYLTTSLDGNWLEFELLDDRTYNVDLRQTYLALKLKFVKSRVYESYNTKATKKERKSGAKTDKKRQRRRTERLHFLSILM